MRVHFKFHCVEVSRDLNPTDTMEVEFFCEDENGAECLPELSGTKLKNK